jgi:hypothetical protein
MESSPQDQTAIMKEVLEALKTLQMNQVQLASHVDAISGRVNVLAGMKEVRDVAESDTMNKQVPKQIESISSIDESQPHDETKIPESPSLPAAQIVEDEVLSSHSRKASVGTSRIILT